MATIFMSEVPIMVCIDSADREDPNNSSPGAFSVKIPTITDVVSATLTDAHVPQTFELITTMTNTLTVWESDPTNLDNMVEISITIEPGTYTAAELVTLLNEAFSYEDEDTANRTYKIRLSYSSTHGRMTIQNQEPDHGDEEGRFSLGLRPGNYQYNPLWEILGFTLNETWDYTENNPQIYQSVDILEAENLYDEGKHVSSLFICCKQLSNPGQLVFSNPLPDRYGVVAKVPVDQTTSQVIFQPSQAQMITFDLRDSRGEGRVLNRLDILVIARMRSGDWYVVDFGGVNGNYTFVLQRMSGVI
jgi:hypothetical protein